MSKITGFMTFERETPGERPVAERVGDKPIQLHLPRNLQTQAARCMDCGIPFCQGHILNGMTSGCPINNHPRMERSDLSRLVASSV